MAAAYNLSNCVALNLSVKSSANSVGRVVDDSRGGEFTNNWARSDMRTNGGSAFKIGNGGSHVNGANCAAVTAASWWITAAPNGSSWSETDWIFIDGQLPKLRWE